jgi:hypothetical protein
MSRKPTPEETFQALADYAALADLEEIDAMSPEQVKAELLKAGLTAEEPGSAAGPVSGSYYKAEAGPPSSASWQEVPLAYDASPSSSVRGPAKGAGGGFMDRLRRGSSAEVFAVAAGVLCLIAAGYGVKTLVKPDVVPLTVADAGSQTPTVPSEAERLKQAGELRRRAKTECEAGQIDACRGDLQQAATLDPEGDQAPAAQALWDAVKKGEGKPAPSGGGGKGEGTRSSSPLPPSSPGK